MGWSMPHFKCLHELYAAQLSTQDQPVRTTRDAHLSGIFVYWLIAGDERMPLVQPFNVEGL